jgi:tetratricopeptide (TPR) repeat protein
MYEEALTVDPGSVTANNNFAWALVYEAKPGERDCKRGLELAQKAVSLSEGKTPAELDTLAEAYRCGGDYDQALATMDQALALKPEQDFYQKHRAEIEAEKGKGKKKAPKKKAR